VSSRWTDRQAGPGAPVKNLQVAAGGSLQPAHDVLCFMQIILLPARYNSDNGWCADRPDSVAMTVWGSGLHRSGDGRGGLMC
jgi:hypothetical protein